MPFSDEGRGGCIIFGTVGQIKVCFLTFGQTMSYGRAAADTHKRTWSLLSVNTTRSTSSSESIAVDAHCHVDIYADRDGVLKRAAEAGVLPVIVTNRPSEYRNLLHFVDGRSDVRLGLGFHPEAAGSVYEDHELAIFGKYVATASWISEIGLHGKLDDVVGSYFGVVPTLTKQMRLLDHVLQLGVTDKMLSVHSREAEGQLIDMLRQAKTSRVVLHWYSGTARRALDPSRARTIRGQRSKYRAVATESMG